MWVIPSQVSASVPGSVDLISVYDSRSETNYEPRTIITCNVKPKGFKANLCEQAGSEMLVESALDRLMPIAVHEFTGQV